MSEPMSTSVRVLLFGNHEEPLLDVIVHLVFFLFTEGASAISSCSASASASSTLIMATSFSRSSSSIGMQGFHSAGTFHCAPLGTHSCRRNVSSQLSHPELLWRWSADMAVLVVWPRQPYGFRSFMASSFVRSQSFTIIGGSFLRSRSLSATRRLRIGLPPIGKR